MPRRALPALLALVALVADLSGGHGVARVALFVAIPASFVLVLDCYADAIAGRCGLMRPVAAALGLGLLLLSATLRSPAVVGGVPHLAVSAIVLCLVLYVGQAFAAVAWRSTTPARTRRAPLREAEVVPPFADAA